jgi:hypothetical protein
VTVEEQLEWEARQRPRAAIYSIAAAVLTLGGGIASAMVFRDLPASSPGTLIFFSEKEVPLILVAVALAAGSVAIALTLNFLFAATKFRRPMLPGMAKFVALFGGIALAVAGLLQQGYIAAEAQSFVDGPLTYDAAKDVLEAPAVLAAAIIRLAGQLAIGMAFVLIALNAMRAGLLTRFMGVLGIIVGVLFVIPLGSPLPIVQSFWLVAFGVLVAGRWPGGKTPPAWETGKEEPWPSMQEMREARQAELAAQRGEVDDSPAADRKPLPAGKNGGASNGGDAAREATGRPRKRRKKRR